MLHITPLPLLSDNYAYYLEETISGQTAIIDPSEAKGVLKFLKGRTLDFILNTHHHPDHTGGNLTLKKETGAPIVGFRGDQHRIPGLDHPLEEGDLFELGHARATLFFVPGHTQGHVAYSFEADQALFTGDTLFSLGCGRLFEGTAEEMWTSFQKIACLPEETRIYCGHEYTLANLAFAKSLFPDDLALQKEEKRLEALREQGKPTIGSTLGFEKRFNPFFLSQKRPCEEGLSNVEIFALRRHLKDDFSPR